MNVALRAAVDALSTVEEEDDGLACVLALRPPEADALAWGAFGEVSKFLDTLSRLSPAALRAIRRVGEVLGEHSREKAEHRSAALSGGGGRSSILEKLKRLAGEDPEACMTGSAPPPEADAAVPPELAARLEDIGPGVGRALMALMNRKHFDNRTLMIRTGISKQLLSKIQNGKHAKAPEKRWLLAVAVAMGLTLEETRGFLSTAGYALSESNPRDVVVAYFLGKGGAQIGMVDAALACLGMETLYPEG